MIASFHLHLAAFTAGLLVPCLAAGADPSIVALCVVAIAFNLLLWAAQRDRGKHAYHH